MKNFNRLLIVLISVAFIASGVIAQNEMSPKLKDQLEVKVKPVNSASDQLTTGSAEKAPTELQQLQQAYPDRDVTQAYWPSEINLNAKSEPIPSDDLFDLQFDFPVGVGGGEAGIETDGDYIYTSMWNGVGDFQKYDIDGTWLETFTVPGSTGCRDIAYNGTYFYGGAASPTVFEMDFSSGTMVSTFTAPTDCRAIAYNEDDDAFYANNWGSDITKFDMAGANLGSFPVGPVGDSYYGFAYNSSALCGDGPFLWGHAQVGNTQNELVQISLPDGAETGVYFDVGTVAAVGTGIAGGLAIHEGLVSGFHTILGTSQNVNIWGLELCPSGPPATNDVGIQAITEPVSGVNLTAAEPVTVVVKNYGTDPQSNFDIWYTLDGGAQFVETITTTLNGGETVTHTFGSTVDLSAYGSYVIDACTDLVGDENADNDCKDKTVTNDEPSLCAPIYSSGCVVGDGFTDFAVEEIQNLGNGCADNTGFTGWSQYFGLGPAILIPGNAHTFTMGCGYSNQYVNIWIDFNDDLDLTPDEIIIQDYVMVDPGVLYDVDITIPANATPGEHVMRAMAVWLNPFTDPCGSYSYGEAEDYKVYIGVAEYGTLTGTVTENTGGAPVDGAMVSVNNGGWTGTTASDGTYTILDVLVGDWDVDVTKDGYNPATANVTITNGGTTTQDFAMTTPTMDIDPLTLSITIDPFTQATEYIDITNNGDGPLAWTGQLELLTEATDDMWDLIFDVPVGIGGGEAGIETDGMNIYTSMWNGTGEFQRYDMAGTWIETISVAGSTGCRDIAYNGTYFYGGAASTTVFEMDLANAAMISTFTAPTDCRAIAYNEDDGYFYANNWGSNITIFDMAGANMGSFAVGPIGDSYYGFAYDNYSAPGTKKLWGYAQVGATQNELVEIDLATQAETGFSLDVGTIAAVGTGIAGGLAIDNNIAPGFWAVLGTSQNVNLWALELAPSSGGGPWIQISPTSGNVDPGNTGQMQVDFDATDVVAGTVKTANIHFASDPDVGTVTVPVSMTVGDLDWGYVEGFVTLDGALPYNIGDVTQVLVEVGPYQGYPDATGFYNIQTYPGTYDVTATLYGYDTQVTSGVVVDENITVTVDITMPCLYGMVAGTVTAEEGGAPIDGATVEVLDTDFETTTAADGTYEIIIEAGTYDVKVTAPFYASQTATVVISAETTTTQDFVMPTLEGVIVVIDLDPTPNPQIQDVIQGFFPGGLVEYTTTINGYPLNEEVQTVFLLLGIFSNNYALLESDAVVITTWLDTYGGNLYMEGGDTWAYDAPTTLHSYFNINGLVDGSGDLINVEGIDSFWNGFTWGYVGENNWIDQIEAIAPAINVCQNPDVGYFNCVAYDEGTYKTVGASYEVTGLVDGMGSFVSGVQTIMGFFDYPVFLYGDLEGNVVDGDGNPVEDALVNVSGLGSDLTDANGDYSITGILVGTWTAYCTKDGYNPDQADVTITDGGLTVQDFVLTAPQFNVDPTNIAITLDPNATAVEYVDIENPGSGTVAWSASLNIQGDGNGDDLFDLIFDVPVGVGGGEAGIETDGQYIYTTMWNGGGEFQRYSMDGTWIETISITSAAGCRDMAYNGTYFYGGAASPTVFEMDLANATMISTFTAPTDCRAIAYNENDDAFYANNWGSDITKFDMAGANLGSFPVGPVGDSYYGFAYDGYSSGAPFLWGYAQVGNTQNELVQISLPDGAETGVYFDVGTVAAVGTGIAGGMGISDQIVSGLYAFLGTSQNVNLWALELGESQTWISIDPTSGSLAPGASETMDVNFDATGLLPGFYYADINFSTNPDVGSPTVTVELEVEGLIPAINLNGMYNCTDVELTWEMPVGGDPDSWNVYKDGTLLGNVDVMEYTDPMVETEVEFAYTVTAVYGAEESFPTPEFLITVPIPDDLPPINPEATDAGSGTAHVTWDAPAACLAPEEYDIYRDNEYIATTTELEYDDMGLEGGFYEYKIKAIYYFGESDFSAPAYVLIIVGINDISANDFEIFPNPASDVVNVKSDYHVNSIEVLNNNGQVVYKHNIESSDFTVNVSTYERGIYYIKLETDQGIVLRKIAVK